MNNVDPDIIGALKTLAADGESARVLQAHKRQDEATQRRFETQMELLSEEVERVVPRSHPFFDVVLILAVARKIERAEALAEARKHPEFIPDFEKGFPQGW